MRVVLPSNSSMQDYYPDNSLATYTVKIPASLDFSVGQWECALTEIQFFKSWINISGAALTLAVDGEATDISIPDSYYNSPKELIKTINQRIDDLWSYKANYDFKLLYMEHTKKCRMMSKLNSGNGVDINLNDTLKKILGLSDMSVITDPSNEYLILEGNVSIQLIHLYDIMIYSDIVQGSIIGDTEAPLLRVVSVEQGNWSKQCTIYQNPQYSPLSKSKFQTISILLRTDTGDAVPFTEGRTIVTLDFRRIKPHYL